MRTNGDRCFLITTTRILAAAFCLSITLAAQGQYSPPTAGLVGWWRGEGNANDSAGPHNGVLQGGLGFTNGMFGQAFEGGSNKRVYIPDDPAFQLTSFTIGAWVNIHANSWIVFCRQSRELTSYSLAGNYDGTIRVTITPNSGPDEYAGAPISYNQWHQVAATLDAAAEKLSLYIDGVLVGQKSTSSTPRLALPVSGDTGLGICNDLNWDFPTLAEVDEVLLYSRALSASEIASLLMCNSPHRATAVAQVVNGFVVGATMTDSGCGYTNVPMVSIAGGGGHGATATAVVSNGTVANVVITDAGVGYTNPPIIYIDSPIGTHVSLTKAVKPAFSELLVGANYQLQVSPDLATWTNSGPAFVATNSAMVYPRYWEVENWNRLFFRAMLAP